MIGGGAVVTESVSKPTKNQANERAAEADEALNQIRDSLRGLQFGSVNIIVQDGVIIQIDRTEKKRLRVNRNNG
jgi:hypothetical protein